MPFAPFRSASNRLAGGRCETATLAVTALALVLFVGIGSSAMTSVLRALSGGAAVDRSLLVALFLNIALILFGWRKHRDLAAETAQWTAAEDRAHVLASRDAPTGLLSRRSLIEHGAALVARAHRRGQAAALLCVDVDQLRSVNELHGHPASDALLRAAAAEILAALPAGGVAARLDGNGFACAFVFDRSHPDTVERVAERLIARVAQPITAGSHRIHASASIGIARSDYDVASFEALIRSAEIATSVARKAGRNRHIWFDKAMAAALQTRTALESGLRAAIPVGEIVPVFEQQVDLATGRLTGFEVLARWDHPTRGTIGPDAFIPIAEETGLVGELSLAVMRRAFAAARDWDGALTLSVNISPIQLRDAWLPQKIIKTLTETGFRASRLEVEITELALLDNLALARSIIASLKNQGIRIALDNFGTGSSSLAHLRALPFDRIKIDRSFVSSMLESADSAAIVAAVAGLGDSFYLPVIAEGIEDRETEARLVALGCSRGQGYLYGRPLSLGDARRLLSGERRLVQTGGELAALRLAG